MDSDKRKDTIILIGPMGVGKSTVAQALAQRLQLPQCPLDQMAHYYYFKEGYDINQAKELEANEGFLAFVQHCQPFYVAAVRGALAEFDHCIIDLGGNHTYVDEAGKAVLKEILSAYEYVILLLPTQDMVQNVKLLNERLRSRWRRKSEDSIQVTLKANIAYLQDPLIYEAANYVFFTSDMEKDELIDEMVRICEFPAAS